MKDLLDQFTDVTNRSVGQTKFLLELCDIDLNKLVELEYKIFNNFLHYCPGDKEEVEKVLAMEDKSDWAFKDNKLKHLKDFLK